MFSLRPLPRRLWTLALLLAVNFALAVPMSSAPAIAQDAAAPVSDAKLQAFVTAAMKVNTLIEQWTPKIQAAAPDQQAQLKQTANAELLNAIQTTPDMSPQEYQQIAQAAQGDPALQQRILAILHSKQAPPAK